MKMLKKAAMMLLVGAMLIGTMTACGSAGTSTQAAGTEGPKLQSLGFLSAAWSDDYCKRLNDALVELGPQYGFEVNAVNGAPDGNPDVTKYMEGIDALLAKNPDAMLIQPLFSVPDYCVQINEKNIPLCFINIAPEISENCKDLQYYYAGCFDTAIGAQLAEEMAKGLKENAKICLMCLPYGQTNAAQRRDGFMEWMQANRPDVEILEVNYVEKTDPTAAQAIFEDWIQKYGVGGFDGVASQGSMMTQGIVECMKSYNLSRENFVLAGISASTSEWIRDGYEFVELYQDPYAEAAAALQTMRHQLDGTTDQLTTMDDTDNIVAVPMQPITADNYQDFDF